MNPEFNELIFSYMNLDLEQKKSALLSLLSENIQTTFNIIKNENENIEYINSDILNELDVKKDNDYLTYLYVLVRQLEDLNAKYISLKKVDE